MWHSVHVIGFLGYTLFAVMHYAGIWVAFVPGEASTYNVAQQIARFLVILEVSIAPVVA